MFKKYGLKNEAGLNRTSETQTLHVTSSTKLSVKKTYIRHPNLLPILFEE